jgi:hypothetical protein
MKGYIPDKFERENNVRKNLKGKINKHGEILF